METVNHLSNALAQYLMGAPEKVWMGYLLQAWQSLGF